MENTQAQVKATFDVTTIEGQIKVFNAQNGTAVSVKDLPAETVIEVNDMIQYQEEVDNYGASQESTVTVLYGTDGNLYASVSATIADAGSKLIDMFTMLSLEKINVKFTKQQSKQGRDFLSMQIAQ